MRRGKYRIGIIGRGYVGSAVESFLTLESDHEVMSYDVLDGKGIGEGYREIAQFSDIIYLCLPTPMNRDGSCCTDIVESAVKSLNFYTKLANKTPVLLIKSTMVPGTSDKLQELASNLLVVTNPEFLTARRAKLDFHTAGRHLLGVPRGKHSIIANVLEKYHQDLWPHAEVVFTEPREAELIKYLTNSYFTVKVSVANQIYDLCDKLDINYEDFIESAVEADPRLGELHWQVPGPDGKRGFGGECFNKDLSGMIYLLNEKQCDASMFKTSEDYNSRIR